MIVGNFSQIRTTRFEHAITDMANLSMVFGFCSDVLAPMTFSLHKRIASLGIEYIAVEKCHKSLGKKRRLPTKILIKIDWNGKFAE